MEKLTSMTGAGVGVGVGVGRGVGLAAGVRTDLEGASGTGVGLGRLLSSVSGRVVRGVVGSGVGAGLSVVSVTRLSSVVSVPVRLTDAEVRAEVVRDSVVVVLRLISEVDGPTDETVASGLEGLSKSEQPPRARPKLKHRALRAIKVLWVLFLRLRCSIALY